MSPEALRRATLVTILTSTLGGYAFLVAALGSRGAIETANVAMLSLASAIVFAYAPVLWQDLRFARLDRAAILSIGIFVSWGAVIYRTGCSIVWRLADKPVDWLDSGLWGLHLPLSCFAAICHLIAPEVLAGRVPTRRWIKIGLIVASGVGLGAGLAVLNLPG
jgi:hypothetical protein